MRSLSRGENVALDAPEVTITVESQAATDLSAFLLASNGKVRGEADFVFYNQPSGPGVALQAGAQPHIRVRTNEIPADIESVRAVITLDDQSSTFGRFAPPIAHVFDSAGTELVNFTADGLTTESVVIAIELYRRNGAWKVRAIGQGYAGGFASLVEDHGVSVDDAPATPTPPPVVHAPPAPAYPPAPQAPAQPGPGGYQAPPSYPAPVPGQQQPAPGYQAPPAYQPPPSYPAPTYGTPPPPAPAYGAPPQPPAPAYGAPEVSLTKNRRVDLTKGQKVSLRKDGGVALTNIRMGLGWDPIEKRGMFGSRTADIDLDASVLMFSRGNLAETVYFGHLRSDDGSINHSGDNLTGQGEGDDEVISVALQAVPPTIDALAFIVTSYQGQTFQEVSNAFCRLIDDTTGAELARFTLQGGMPFTGVAMAVIQREPGTGEWKLRAMGDGFDAKTPKKALPHVQRLLGIA